MLISRRLWGEVKDREWMREARESMTYPRHSNCLCWRRPDPESTRYWLYRTGLQFLGIYGYITAPRRDGEDILCSASEESGAAGEEGRTHIVADLDGIIIWAIVDVGAGSGTSGERNNTVDVKVLEELEGVTDVAGRGQGIAGEAAGG